MATSTRAERRRAQRARGRTDPTTRRRWPILAGVALLAAVALAALLGGIGTGSDALAAERTQHDFGAVRMRDGLLAASFPLAVGGTVHVTDLGTT
jgi:hypothetical protein